VIVIEDHHAAAEANAGLSILGGGGEDARILFREGAINMLSHLVGELDHGKNTSIDERQPLRT
jgi:hypothetical protein